MITFLYVPGRHVWLDLTFAYHKLQQPRQIGDQELPARGLLKFNSASQKDDEGVKHWADRVWELAAEAFPLLGTE